MMSSQNFWGELWQKCICQDWPNKIYLMRNGTFPRSCKIRKRPSEYWHASSNLFAFWNSFPIREHRSRLRGSKRDIVVLPVEAIASFIMAMKNPSMLSASFTDGGTSCGFCLV